MMKRKKLSIFLTKWGNKNHPLNQIAVNYEFTTSGRKRAQLSRIRGIRYQNWKNLHIRQNWVVYDDPY